MLFDNFFKNLLFYWLTVAAMTLVFYLVNHRGPSAGVIMGVTAGALYYLWLRSRKRDR